MIVSLMRFPPLGQRINQQPENVGQGILTDPPSLPYVTRANLIQALVSWVVGRDKSLAVDQIRTAYAPDYAVTASDPYDQIFRLNVSREFPF